VPNLSFFKSPGHWASNTAGAITVFSPSGTTLAAAPFDFATGNYTIEMFVFNEGGVGARCICDMRNTVLTGIPLLYTNTSGVVVFSFGNTERIVGTTVLLSNQWYHIALSRVSSQTRLFVNGIQQGATFADSTNYVAPIAATPFRIGYSILGGTPSLIDWVGYVSNVRVIKGTGLYSANFTPPSSPLTAVAGTSLLTCNNSTLTDSSTNAYQMIKDGSRITGPRFDDIQVDYLDGPFANSYTATSRSSTFDDLDDYTNDYIGEVTSIGIKPVLDLITDKYILRSPTKLPDGVDRVDDVGSVTPKLFGTVVYQTGSVIPQYWS
jgi:hypothetical protein